VNREPCHPYHAGVDYLQTGQSETHELLDGCFDILQFLPLASVVGHFAVDDLVAAFEVVDPVLASREARNVE
jgi:hypothetical protein